ncbi:S9 family peptidase [Thermoflexibacter ruber]|uniref:Dipeptidyl aminopeptidase/acylaminoacyl peptidase n=1 Tax=Thermoflexibacter ruber TaxID=1003 RepID=A0A1I2JCX7_9BACT|nr:prolyl oligopeptidase family serine peptidase [Thermoflexibacter ruber]SFF51027.1 Dipeptidyl aminopeptidase/acylaminoacyl peptidase [Thermoflexibacter ruber]
MKKLLFILLLLYCFAASAQQKGGKQTALVSTKKPLTHSVYDSWKEIGFRAVSNDGSWAVYTVNPQEGDGKVIFYNLKTNQIDSVQRASQVEISQDNQFVVFKIAPPLKIMKDLRRQKKKKEDLPRDTLGIYNLQTKQLAKVANLKSFKLPEKAGAWLAYQIEQIEKKETPKKDTAKEVKKEEAKKPAKPKKKESEENGYRLVMRKLANAKETTFDFVKEYKFDKFGKNLIFSTTGNDSTLLAGVYVYDLQSEKLKPLFRAKKGNFKNLAFDESGSQVAFVADLDTTKTQVRYFKLYHWKNGQDSALAIADTTNITKGLLVSEHYVPNFSQNGAKLFFGMANKPVVQDTTLLPEEIVNLDIWHWQDDYIQPQQGRRLEQDKKRSYLSVYHVDSKRIVQLATNEVPSISLANEGNANLALASSDVPYRRLTNWDISGFEDLYLLDLQTGNKKLIQQKIKGDAAISPQGNYVYWFSLPDTAWFTYSVKSGQIFKLNQGLKEKFADEEDDHPDYPLEYGFAGWTENDQTFLVYDRYDIWAFDPENRKAPVNLTQTGRKEKLVFRNIRLDQEEKFFKADQTLLLSVFDETTKQSGYYSLNLKDNSKQKLLMDNYRFSTFQTRKAKDASVLLFTRESFKDYPDLYATDLTFKNIKKISEANPQQKDYAWGSVEMYSWLSLDGIPLQGLLYKPENFDPKKQYPMMVYYYEKNSDNIHNHIVPAPIRSAINYTYFVSNGYLVFVPDVVYRIGYPGESAYNCIMPAVTSLIEKGFVNKERIGIQGHSWGGYQNAYLITKTNLFRAAEAGAPVSNMVSAYGGIRWESGYSRMFQYEKSQSRIGGTLWEKPLRFLENSPIFFADKVNTPLLMMHNDEDGAVPWYQGIEYFMALRRLGKPVWMLNYNKEAHGLTQRQNRKDFAIRMYQFFDYYLKDAPMPEWMKKGVPMLEKGVNKGLTLMNEEKE